MVVLTSVYSHLRRPSRLRGLTSLAVGLAWVSLGSDGRAAAQAALISTPKIAAQASQQAKPASVVVGSTTYYPYIFEGHVHTSHSIDARASTVSILQAAEKLGLDAIIITDHGSSDAKRDFANYKGPLVPIIGSEIGGQFGHAVMWQVDANDTHNPARTTLQERCDYAHERGGLLVWAHPGWWIAGNDHDPMEWMTPNSLRRGGPAGDIDAIEIWNGVYRTPLPKLIDSWVELLEAGVYVPIVGNSDFHRFEFHWLASAHNIAFCDKPDVSTCLWPAVRAGHVIVSDGPYAVFSVNDQLPGSIIAAPTEPLRLSVEALAPEGGTLRVYLGTQQIQTLILPPGERGRATWQVPVPSADTFLRIDILRARKAPGQTAISLLSNPVLIDVGPRHVWR